jgi:hypothetical protein
MGQDIIILVKKILIGIVFLLAPFLIYFVGLWLLRKIM